MTKLLFLKNYRESVSLGATDLLLSPVFDGKLVQLVYTRGLLLSKLPDDVIRRSGIRRNLFEGLASVPMGLGVPKHVSILGYRVEYNNRLWFIAEEICTGLDPEQIGAALPLQVHFLKSRGFLTPQGLLSWASVTGVEYNGSPKTRELPTSKSEAVALARDRIKVLGQVLLREKPSYWGSPKPESTKRLLPVAGVTGVRLAYATVPHRPILKFSLATNLES